MNEKRFPIPGDLWQWRGNDVAPPSPEPRQVTGLRWFHGRAEVLFNGNSCAAVEHMMTLDAWELVQPSDGGPLIVPDSAESLAWARGNGAAYARMLQLIAGELGVDTSEGKIAALLAERERTVAALRKVCAEHGDNDWPDNTHLPDVINKFLAPYLDNEEP